MRDSFVGNSKIKVQNAKLRKSHFNSKIKVQNAKLRKALAFSTFLIFHF